MSALLDGTALWEMQSSFRLGVNKMSANMNATALMDVIEDWLKTMPEKLKVACETDSQKELNQTLTSLGYGEPFDSEQRAINEKLIQARAGGMASLVIWGFYQDYKICGQSY